MARFRCVGRRSAVWRWAAANAERLGTTAHGLHLGGASAGANLVAGVAKRLRDGAGPMPPSVIRVAAGQR